MADIFEIAGRIHSTSQEEVTTTADEILDESLGMKQNELNAEISSIGAAVQGLNPEQQEALSVAEKANSNEAKIGYYLCDTAASTAAKTVSSTTYTLGLGGSVKIKFEHANTVASGVTLKIGTAEAKPLYYEGAAVSANNTWEDDETVEVYYDGTNYYANNVAGGSGDGVFDLTAKTGNTYATLNDALTAANTIISANKKKGGMSIKFVQSSDNKYVQYRLMSDTFNTTVANWQGVDAVPTKDSKNFVESGGVYGSLIPIIGGDISLSPQTEGAYILLNGTKCTGSSNEWALTEPIELSKGDTIKATFQTQNNTAAFSKLNENNTYTVLVGVLGTYEEHSYTAVEDCKVVIGAYINHNHPITNVVLVKQTGLKLKTGQLLKDTSIVNNLTSGGENNVLSAEQGKQIKTLIDAQGENIGAVQQALIGGDVPISPNTEAAYILANGTKTAGAANEWALTEPIDLKKGEILKATFKIGLNVAAFSKVSGVEPNVTYTPLVIGPLSYEEHSYTATEDCKVVIGAYIHNNNPLSNVAITKLSALHFNTGQVLKDTSIINDLTTGGVNDVLSAEQGKQIKILIDSQSTSIDKLSNDLQSVQEDLNGRVSSITPATTQEYIASNGTKVVPGNSEWALTEPISLNAGDTLSATFEGQANTAQFAKVNDNNTYTPLVVSDTGYKEHSYTAAEDCRVVITAYVHRNPLSDVYIVRVKDSIHGEIQGINELLRINEVDEITANVVDGFISYSANSSSNQNYKITSPIKLFAGDKITCRTMLGATMGAISICEEDGTPVEVVVPGIDNDNANDYEYTANVDCYVRIGGKTAYVPKNISIIRNNTTNVNKKNIDAIGKIIPDVENLLEKILVIGDSLTEGAEITSTLQARVITENYPYYLAKITKLDVHKEAESGWSASNMWNGGTRHAADNTTYSWDGFKGNYDFTPYDSFIIWLGTNQGLTDTLEDDVIPFDDYNDYAETQTGYYCKIIAKIISQVPNAKIFLCTVFDSKTSVETTNLVLGKIATLYNDNVVGVINNGVGTICYNEWAYYNVIFHNLSRNQPHYNKVGYYFVAKHILDEMRKLIYDRLSIFKNPILPVYNRGSVG